MATMRGNLVGGLVLAVLAGGLVLWSAPAAADAAATYKAKCAMCHGVDGKGETPVGKKMGAGDFSSPDVQKQSDADLAAITAKGKNKMPSFGKSLKPEEIKDLIDYIRKFASGK
jgi:mono/diheme cytochrome c family protein